MPDLKARLMIKTMDPKPIDKCTVCFWGQDVTTAVMKGLKEQLDEAKTDMERNFGTYDLRPKFQEIWNHLNKVYDLYGLGWLQINPTKIRVNNLFARNDSLNIYAGLAAKPLISFEKPQEHLTVAPNLSDFSYRPGFNIFLDALLNYDSLSRIVTAELRDKRFDVSQGKYIIVKDCELYGVDNENLVIKITFSGSQDGLFYLTGKPSYEPQTRIIELKDVDFDIKTKNMLMKTAQWLFNKRMLNEIRKYTRFDLSTYISNAVSAINQQMNREWTKGIQSSGKIENIRIVNMYPLRDHLVVRSNCSGNLSVKIDAGSFSL